MASNEKKKEGGQGCGSVQKCLPVSGPSSAQAECCKRMRANSHTRPTFMETIFLEKKFLGNQFLSSPFATRKFCIAKKYLFFKIYFHFMCLSVLPSGVYAYHMHTWDQKRLKSLSDAQGLQL